MQEFIILILSRPFLKIYLLPLVCYSKMVPSSIKLTKNTFEIISIVSRESGQFNVLVCYLMTRSIGKGIKLIGPLESGCA